MRQYINKVGDPSPESQRVLLPACLSIKAVYEEYKTCTKKEEVIQMKRFYQIWKKSFPHVSCPKVKEHINELNK